MQRLVDGPFPAWMITASIAATILTIIPVATVGLNHHMTMRGYFPLMRYSPTLRFTVFGAIAYTAFSIVGVLISLRSMAQIRSLHRGEHRLFAPRSLRVFHDGDVWFDVLHRAATGRPRMALRVADQTALLVLRLWRWSDGGDASRRRLRPGTEHERPVAFLYRKHAIGSALSARPQSFRILLTVAHFIFAFHFGLMLFGLGRTASVPTFLNPIEPEEVDIR